MNINLLTIDFIDYYVTCLKLLCEQIAGILNALPVDRGCNKEGT